MDLEQLLSKHPVGLKLLALMQDFDDTDFFGVCAQMAFYLMLSLIPMLIFLINFVGRFIVQFEASLNALLAQYLPEASYEYVIALISLIQEKNGSHYYLLLIFTFYFASLAARTIMTGMNSSYGFEQTQSKLMLRLRSMEYTLLFSIAIIFVFLAYIGSEYFLEIIMTNLQFESFTIDLTEILSKFFIIVISTLLLLVIYTIGPEKHFPVRSALPGALFASAGINFGFRIFVGLMNHSIKYAMMYGQYSGLFALLVVIYYVCIILNLGAKLNVYLSERKELSA